MRELKVITLEEAVRKATSHNAAKIRIYDRSILRPGMKADITVFNPDTIIDKATFDNPHQYAEGVEYVIVNGTVVLDEGEHTGARPGQILSAQGRRINASSKGQPPGFTAQFRQRQQRHRERKPGACPHRLPHRLPSASKAVFLVGFFVAGSGRF